MNDKEVLSTPAPAAEYVFARLKGESKAWEAQGKDAWSALARLRGNLPPGDEVVLAKRLYDEYRRLKLVLKEQKVGIGEFCMRAGLGMEGHYTKELHRMMLPPDKDASKVRLRRSAVKYRCLMSEMARVFGESRSVLANRLMVGTSLHPANAIVRDEVDGLQTSLQKIVDEVDSEFGLFQTFMETAVLKAEHAAERGKCRWPQYDADYRVDHISPVGEELWLRRFRAESSCFDDKPFDQLDKEAQELIRADEDAASWAEAEAAMDTSRAYWEQRVDELGNTYTFWLGGPTPSGCLQDDEFFYVPHAYIGDGVGVSNSPDKSLAPAAHDRGIAQLKEWILSDYAEYGLRPDDGWDDVTQQPRGQTSSLKHSRANHHAWLVAYPAPDNTRLMPMLLIPVEECGPILVPLDAVTLSGLRHAYWVGPDGEVMTFFERIRSLIGLRPGEPNAILEGLRATAPWLSKNPFMKMKIRRSEELALMHRFLLNGLPGKASNNQA